ncbi:MAG: type II toxin-antitoxin system HicB family antitoxin [Magnetococcales bacterium]|nr:type II toxin-antitoxin system HicB family antitoxin [Magnetococcales bacterium]
MSLTFPIAIEPGDQHHAFGVVVPDLPGCFSAGDTMEEVLVKAREAILMHLEGMIEEGIEFPAVKSIEQHMTNLEFAGWIWAMIAVDDIRETYQPIRVNITIPKHLLNRIDRHATTRHMTRSGLLADAARQLLEMAD